MRIVSHSCSNTEIVCALGCADWLVGVDDHSDYPPDTVENLPRVGADLDVDPEAVKALKPDLIIASDTVPGHDKVIENLRQTGIPMLVTAPRCLDDVAGDIQRVADALDLPERGRQLAAEFRSELQKHTTEPPVTRPKVLVEWWPKPVIAPGRQSWVTELLERAGGINPWAEEDCQSREISTSEARDVDPHYIVMAWCGVPEKNYRPHIVSRRDGWQDITAVKQQRIVAISEAYLGRPGPRLITGLRKITAMLDT